MSKLFGFVLVLLAACGGSVDVPLEEEQTTDAAEPEEVATPDAGAPSCCAYAEPLCVPSSCCELVAEGFTDPGLAECCECWKASLR